MQLISASLALTPCLEQVPQQTRQVQEQEHQLAGPMISEQSWQQTRTRSYISS